MQPRILVVDDFEDYATYLVTFLRRAGYDARAVRFGRGAREAILAHHAERRLDLVITDLFMPEPDGFEILRFVRARLPGVPVIAISGSGSRLLDAMKTFGATSVLPKPVDHQALLQAIAACLPNAVPRLPVTAAGGVKKRILVVDDHEDLCEAAAIGLARHGHEVRQFNNPCAALAEILRDPAAWDLVITDENMPELRGLQLLKRLKLVRRDLPVIVWTGFGETPEELARAWGADGYLKKPVETARLAAEVALILSLAA